MARRVWSPEGLSGLQWMGAYDVERIWPSIDVVRCPEWECLTWGGMPNVGVAHMGGGVPSREKVSQQGPIMILVCPCTQVLR